MPRALVLESTQEVVTASVLNIQEDRLPAGEVLIDVLYSSLNYKDALAVTGKGKVVRASYPFVPGIDVVGRVRTSASKRYHGGDVVLATGWGLGESRWGGYSSVQRLEVSQLVPLPETMTPDSAMTAGTAGLTAMLSVMRLESLGISPERGRVLVTGASGGVGSFAVAILSKAGYRVDASTGSKDAHAYLRRLGADRIIEREELSSGAVRPLDTARWGAAVDVVGGNTLEAVVSRLHRHGAVAACGHAGGSALNTTVFPFILRGVSLLGIDSNTCPADVREKAWKRLAELATDELLDEIRTATIGLEQIPEYCERLIAGELRGRVVVDVNRRGAVPS